MSNLQLQARRKQKREDDWGKEKKAKNEKNEEKTEDGWFDAFDSKLPKKDAEKWLEELSKNSIFEYRLIKKGDQPKAK